MLRTLGLRDQKPLTQSFLNRLTLENDLQHFGSILASIYHHRVSLVMSIGVVVNGGWAVAHPPILRLPKRSDKVSITAAKRTGLPLKL